MIRDDSPAIPISGSAVRQLLSQVVRTLNALKIAGTDRLDCSAETLGKIENFGKPTPPKLESLDDIRADLGDCQRCKLCEKRHHIVFGEGSPNATLMFVGEGPGADEDASGRPFVGKAGQLLTKIIAAIGLSREAVYITNIVKCRPPGNRVPEQDEIGRCLPFLHRQIRSINPDYICTLGAPASQTLLNKEIPISRMRGRFYGLKGYEGIRVLPTFHPSYLLRHEEKKREVWQDMKMLMREMG
jgi:uracil-DNA glycosylase family 4